MERAAARQQLLEIYAGVLRAIAGDVLVKTHLATTPVAGAVHVVAIGKAAEAMARGARQALGERLQRGLLVTKHGYLLQPLDSRWEQLEAGHPVPDVDSLHAGQRLLEFIDTLPREAHLLFLISGGASSLVEVSPAGISPEQLDQLNRWLLASGLEIDAVNRVRKGISSLKAGRLARHLCRRQVTQLLLSDVPGNDPRVIGSGLLVAHAQSDLVTDHLPLPEWVTALLKQSPPLAEAECFSSITTHLLAGNRAARLAAQDEAARRGIEVVHHDSDYQGEAIHLGEAFARTLLEASGVLHVWGGEATVKLPAEPGRGGRSQQLALAAARQLAGSNALLLAAGTDGSDGPGEDAGALVDGHTLSRGEAEGENVHRALACADAGHFLEASGDLLQTGPTGSNVMDLVLGWNPA